VLNHELPASILSEPSALSAPAVGIRTVSFRMTETCDKRRLHRMLELALHFQNLIILLYDRARNLDKNQQDNESSKLAHHFLDKGVMRAIAWGQKGGKREPVIKAMVQHFGEWELFKSLQETGRQLKDKNVYQLVGKVAAAYKSFWTKKKNPSPDNRADLAKPPRPRKLKTLESHSFSIPIDRECLSFKNDDVLSINLRPGEALGVTFPHRPLLQVVESFNNIRQLEIGIRHGEIFLYFNYEKPLSSGELGKHSCGLDLGINNLAALYIDDRDAHQDQTPSVLIDGQFFTSYNAEANRKIAKKHSLKDQLQNKKQYLAAVKVQGSINKLFLDRRHFFDTNLAKLAKRTLEGLAKKDVGTLVTSKNLTSLKNNFTAASMGKKQNQRFFQMPLGTFLKNLELNAASYGIKIKFIDEAYTSKASALNGDPWQAQQEGKSLKLLGKIKGNPESSIAAKAIKQRLSDALGGERVSRSRYRDKATGIIFHADISAAFNHLRVFYANLFSGGVTTLKARLVKLANPRKIQPHALNSFLDSVGNFAMNSSQREQARNSHQRIRSRAVRSNSLAAAL